MKKAATLVLAATLFAAGAAGLAGAATPAGYSEYYTPGLEEQLWEALVDFDNDPPLDPAAGMHSLVSVTASLPQTTLYYDHWENGYNFDPADPAATADEIYVLGRGEVKVFESSHVPVAPRGNATYYDGGDRIYAAGGPVSVSRVFWPESCGTVFAAAWEVYPVGVLQADYAAPFGEDLAAAGYSDFKRVYAFVEAVADGTTVTITHPGADEPYIDVLLEKGEGAAAFGVLAGDAISASAPVEAHYLVGQPRINYEARGFGATPEAFWSAEYYSPVGASETEFYIYNPYAGSLTVSYEDGAGAGTFAVPARGTLSYSDGAGRRPPAAAGVYLAADRPFWAVGSVGTEDQRFDWGFSLQPADELDDEYFVGWAPGSSETVPTMNGSPIFVTTTGDGTAVFVDYSPLDGIADATFILNRLETRKIFDPDNDNTGMHIWATGPLAAVWGEDPDLAGAGNPYMDLGAALAPVFRSGTDSVLALEAAVDPAALPRQADRVVSFSLEVRTFEYAVEAVGVRHTLAPDFSYVDGSSSIDLPDGSILEGSAAEPDVEGREIRWDLGQDMAPGETLTVRFEARTDAPPAAEYSRHESWAEGLRFDGAQVFSPLDATYVRVTDPDPNDEPTPTPTATPTATPAAGGDAEPSADLSLTFEAGRSTLAVGETTTLAATVRNAGPDDATGVTAHLFLPADLSYVSAFGDGTFNRVYGLWTVGDLAAGGERRLYVEVRADAAGEANPYGKIETSDLADPDSTPGNGVLEEDDMASVRIVVEADGTGGTSGTDGTTCPQTNGCCCCCSDCPDNNTAADDGTTGTDGGSSGQSASGDDASTSGSAAADDSFTLQGGGCTIAPAGRRDVSLAFLLLPLCLFGVVRFLRRRRARPLPVALWIVLALALLAPAASRAEPQLDVQAFRPSPFSGSLFSLSKERPQGRGALNAGFIFDYQRNPLVFQRSGGAQTTTRDVVAGQTAGDFLLGYGLTERLDLGLDFPVVFQQDGQGLEDGPAPEAYGVGDLRLYPRLHLYSYRDGLVSVTFSPILSIPTGRLTGRYMGEKNVAFNPQLAAGVNFSRFGFAAAFSYLVRENQVVEDLSLGDELRFKAGLWFYVIRGRLEAAAELNGATNAAHPFENTNQSPLEATVGGKYRIGKGLLLSCGAGMGLVEGYSAPDYRVFAGFVWSSAGREARRFAEDGDRDADGILDAFDACPDDPEDGDGFQDEDGCPEPDNDGDGLCDPWIAADSADGICVSADACPADPETFNGYQDADGCPDSPIFVRSGKIVFVGDVYFSFDRTDIRQESYPLLDELARFFIDHPEIQKLKITGSADVRGTGDYNLRLSAERARRVARYLARKGVEQDRLVCRGLGEEGDGSARTISEEEYQRHRRVEFEILRTTDLAGEETKTYHTELGG